MRTQRSAAGADKLIRQSTVEMVAHAIRERILKGDLAEGEQLLQTQLGEELGVSRIPLREALRQLEAEGLVTIESHKGGIVSVLSVDEISELFEIRACLEGWLLSLAIPRMTEDDIENAERILKAMHHGEVEHWSELNWQFHEALYSPADRPTALKMARQAHRNVERYIRLHIGLSDGWQAAAKEHAEIVDFCRTRDVRRASAALELHIMNASQELIRQLTHIRGS